MPIAPDRLQRIRRFPDLIDYLRDELDWPTEDFAFDDLTFEYEPAELGLKDEEAVKVKTIRQLRPLHQAQPWGIFFVEFGKKRLPIVVLRRILRHLVFKKRASANKTERPAWQARDLLFISATGEDADRELTFAHFVQREDTGLAELRVLGWDTDDTPLHMDYVARTLSDKLRWRDAYERDPDTWRREWSAAFLLRHRHVIRTSEELSVALAELARNAKVKERLQSILATCPEHLSARAMLEFGQRPETPEMRASQFAGRIEVIVEPFLRLDDPETDLSELKATLEATKLDLSRLRSSVPLEARAFLTAAEDLIGAAELYLNLSNKDTAIATQRLRETYEAIKRLDGQRSALGLAPAVDE